MNKTISSLTLALGLTAAAQAQTVYLTGSTAFRSQVFAALADLGLSVQQGATSGATLMTYTGTISDTTGGNLGLSTNAPGFAGDTVTVYCNWSGSVEGITAVVSPRSATYDSVGSGTFNHTGDDIAFSDVSQSVASYGTANSADQLEEVQLPSDAAIKPHSGIAVQPFTFIVNANASAIQNITYQNFADLYGGTGNGKLGMNFFGGSNTTPVYAVGRYPLSGTHQTIVVDDVYPVFGPLTQWALSADGSTTPGLASTDSASPPNPGNQWLPVTTNGYFTGGNVAKAIEYSSVTGSEAPAAIGYVGFADADKLTGQNGDGAIKWNGQYPGVVNSWNIAGVENGSYTLWDYERLYVADSDQGTFVDQTFAPGLIAAVQYEIKKASPRTACCESEMQVYRASDAGDVVHY
ncbi:MAG: hypothetical protein ACLQU4_02700 [Limisphaerales bacterium]